MPEYPSATSAPWPSQSTPGTGGGTYGVLQGEFDLGSVRSSLKDAGYTGGEYHGYEVWEEGGAVAILEEEGYLITGKQPEAVRHVLRSLERGRLMFNDSTHPINPVLKQAGGGWLAAAIGGCPKMVREDRSCMATAFSASTGDSGSAELAISIMFENWDRDRPEERKLEDALDRIRDGIPSFKPGDARSKGRFINASASVDMDELGTLWDTVTNAGW